MYSAEPSSAAPLPFLSPFLVHARCEGCSQLYERERPRAAEWMWVSVLRAKVKPVAGVAEVGRIRVTDQRAPRERPAPGNPPRPRRGPSVSSRARIASKTRALYPAIRSPARSACIRTFSFSPPSTVLLSRRDHPPFSLAGHPSPIVRATALRSRPAPCFLPHSALSSLLVPLLLAATSLLSISLSSPHSLLHGSFLSLVVLSLAKRSRRSRPSADTAAYLLDYLVLGTGYSVLGTRYPVYTDRPPRSGGHATPGPTAFVPSIAFLLASPFGWSYSSPVWFSAKKKSTTHALCVLPRSSSSCSLFNEAARVLLLVFIRIRSSSRKEDPADAPLCPDDALIPRALVGVTPSYPRGMAASPIATGS